MNAASVFSSQWTGAAIVAIFQTELIANCPRSGDSQENSSFKVLRRG